MKNYRGSPLLQGMLLLLIVISCAAFLCPGCVKKQGAPPLVGIVLKDNTNPKFTEMEKGARKGAQEERCDILVLAPEKRDPEKQALLVNDLIDMKVNALCIAPENAVNCIEAIAKATSRKIPVVLLDSGIDIDEAKRLKAEVSGMIQGDDFHGGEMAGQYFVKKLGGKGMVAVMEGTPKSMTGKNKREGFLNALKGSPEIRVIYTRPGYYKRSTGFEVSLNLFRDYPELKGVFAFNDMMAIGISDSIVVSGREGSLIIVGYDATEEGRRAIKEGRIDASVFVNPFYMGRIAVKQAIMAHRGEKIPPLTLIKAEFILKDSMLLPFE
ncbi:MAG: sugar ABC transporter substrate-binding protein [Candidatus Eremiobacteraeota bacterium]|nr:sugar ABC transporter substrate-binding protein [Candidatus Eremiobacteraeota bacterium]